MRLIDADALKETIFEKTDSLEDLWDTAGVLNAINNAPTVEPETKVVANITFNKEETEELVEKAKADILAQIERPQGEWEYVDYGNGCGNWHCTSCRNICVEMRLAKDNYNFCPNCGARLGGEKT